MTFVDRLLGGYVAVVTIIIIVRGGLFDWDIWLLLTAHALFFAMLWMFTKLGPSHGTGQFLHAFYPVLLLLAFYGEIGVLNMRGDAAATYANDQLIQTWELAVFRSQISYEWIRRAPSVFWSGLLHFAYLLYYPILVLGPLVLWVAGRQRGAQRTIQLMMMAFVPCYLTFLLFPVAGPNWVFAPPSGGVREVWSARIVYDVLDAGSSFGAAFPSSHVAAAGAVVLGALTEWRRWGIVLAVPTMVLFVGTIYCQMHYGVDVLAGLLVLAGVTALRSLRAA